MSRTKVEYGSARSTFSLTTNDIGTRYSMAKNMGVTIGSVVRHDLHTLEKLVSAYEQSISEKKDLHTKCQHIVQILSSTHLARTEHVPSIDDIKALLLNVRADTLVEVLEKDALKGTLQCAWMIHRAREMSAGVI